MSGAAAGGIGERLAECRAILGGERSGMRAVWDNTANDKQRRVLLAMAGRTEGGLCSMWASQSWAALPEYLRSEIVVGLRRFRTWADEAGV